MILEAFSLPGELPFDLFGDVVTSMFAKILARFAGERPDVVDALIRDSQLNEYVRWEAAQCYVYLVRDGRFTREEAVERLRQHLQQAIAERDEASCAPGQPLTSSPPQSPRPRRLRRTFILQRLRTQPTPWQFPWTRTAPKSIATIPAPAAAVRSSRSAADLAGDALREGRRSALQ